MLDKGKPPIGHIQRLGLNCASLALGHIRYFNLEAKKSFLDGLSIPLGLVRGVVGTLEVKLSASSIFSNEPLKLRVR